MLEKIRQSSQSGGTYVLVGLLIVVFAVFFGVPGDGCSAGASRKLVAQVEGTDLYTDDVGLMVNRWFAGQRRVEDEQLRQQRAQALRATLIIHLLAYNAKQHGLRVSDQELVDYLKDPLRNIDFRNAYGRDGGFDGGIYKAYVQNQLRISIPRYEEFKRNELLATKYLNLIEMQFRATGWEIEELNNLRNTKVDLEFATLDPQALAEFVPVTDEEVLAYVTEKSGAVQARYDSEKEKYETPEKFLIRRIFVVKPEEDEGEDRVKKAIETWDKVKSELAADESKFADIAGTYSDSEKETQGLMEWTTLDNLDQNIADKVKGLEKGATAEIVTEYAFMLIKLEDKKAATKTPLEAVQNDIARALLQEQKSAELVKSMSDELKAALAGKESLADAVQSLAGSEPAEGEGEEPTPQDESAQRWKGVTVDTTGEFTLEGQDLSSMFGGQIPGMSSRTPWDRVPKIGKSPELAKDAFTKLTTENPVASEPYIINGKHYFVRLAKRVDPSDDEDAKKADAEIGDEIRSSRISDLLGPYASVMVFPMDDYGHFIEGLLDAALSDGSIKLFERNYDAIPLIRKDKDDNKPIDLSKPKEEQETEKS